MTTERVSALPVNQGNRDSYHGMMPCVGLVIASMPMCAAAMRRHTNQLPCDMCHT